jgi:RNA polymerase sigma-70 factor, ECF subfamily
MRRLGTDTELVVSEDELLMEQVKGGDINAFGELYDRYCDRAYRVAWVVCHDRGRTEDAVQEAFLSLWKGRAAYLPGGGTVAAWLLTAVRYRAIDVVRRDAKQVSRRAGGHIPNLRPTPGDIADHIVNHEEAQRLRALLTQLPDSQQEVIALAFYGELTHTEIATALRLPAGTVKGRMRLGLQKLRAGIEKEVA